MRAGPSLYVGGGSGGSLPVNGFAGAVTIGTGGSLSVAADTDGVTGIIGRWKFYTTSADVAAIAHFDLADGQNYALRTNSAATALNAPTGGSLFFKVGDVLLGTMASGQFVLGASVYMEMVEMTAPAAPAANGVRLFAQDNGSGKTQLMAIFSSGAAQQVAIQP